MTSTEARQGWQPLTSPSVWSPPLPLTGQLVPTPPAPAPGPAPLPMPPASPATPSRPDEIRIGADGRIQGVDGMLDQIAQALAKHAGPMLARDVLPILQRDGALQMRVGQSAGTALADRLRTDAELQTRVGQAAGAAVSASIKPWVIAGASALAVIAGIQAYQLYTATRARNAR